MSSEGKKILKEIEEIRNEKKPPRIPLTAGFDKDDYIFLLKQSKETCISIPEILRRLVKRHRNRTNKVNIKNDIF